MTRSKMQSIRLDTLPVEDIKLTSDEKSFIDTVITSTNNGKLNSIVSSMRHVLLAGVLFIIISLPQIISLLHKTIPFSSSSLIIELIVRAIIFMALFWILDESFLR